MYINSGGGVVTAGLAIYDTMQVQPLGCCFWCCYAIAPSATFCCVAAGVAV